LAQSNREDPHGHRQTSTPGALMMAPAVVLLLIWMIVPLAMTLYFSFQRYNLLNPANVGFAGVWFNYQYFYTDPAFWPAISTRWCWSSACWPSPSSAAS
jgi:ABC-type sugar transport system permease subunit